MLLPCGGKIFYCLISYLSGVGMYKTGISYLGVGLLGSDQDRGMLEP